MLDFSTLCFLCNTACFCIWILPFNMSALWFLDRFSCCIFASVPSHPFLLSVRASCPIWHVLSNSPAHLLFPIYTGSGDLLRKCKGPFVNQCTKKNNNLCVIMQSCTDSGNVWWAKIYLIHKMLSGKPAIYFFFLASFIVQHQIIIWGFDKNKKVSVFPKQNHSFYYMSFDKCLLQNVVSWDLQRDVRNSLNIKSGALFHLMESAVPKVKLSSFLLCFLLVIIWINCKQQQKLLRATNAVLTVPWRKSITANAVVLYDVWFNNLSSESHGLVRTTALKEEVLLY